MAAPYQLPSSFSGGMAGAVESLKRGSIPQSINSPVVKPEQARQTVLPKKIDKSSESFKNKILAKFPEGVTNDGRRYADIPSAELTKMIADKFPEGVTNEGVPYKDYLSQTDKLSVGLDRFGKAPGANIRESIIQSGKEMGRGLVQPVIGLGKGLYKAGTDIADMADLNMEKAPEDRGIIQKTLANVGTGIKDYSLADAKAFQQDPSIKTAIGMYNPFSEKKVGAASRVLNRGISDVVGGAMQTVLTPEAQQTVGTILSPVAAVYNKGLSYVPEGDKRDIAEAALNIAPIKIPFVKRGLTNLADEASKLKLPKAKPGNIDDYILKTYEKGVRPSVTSAKKPLYKDNVVGAVKAITENKPNLKLLDEFGEETGKLPQTLKEFTQAIDQTKKNIFDEYDALQKQAGGKGAEVKLTTVADELQKVANDPVILDTNPAIADYAQKASERFLERGKYTTQQAQDAIKTYNTSLDAFYKNPSYETASKAAIDAMIVNNMRKGLDDAIESLGGKGYQALKNKYGSVRSIEKDVVNRMIVDGRKNAKGLLDFTDIATGAETIYSILTLNPARFATGIGARVIKEYYKYLNNPNTSIKKLFKTTEKNYLPSPKTQPANNIAPIPTKIDSNAPIENKVIAPIISKKEVKAKSSLPQVEGKTAETTRITIKDGAEWTPDSKIAQDIFYVDRNGIRQTEFESIGKKIKGQRAGYTMEEYLNKNGLSKDDFSLNKGTDGADGLYTLNEKGLSKLEKLRAGTKPKSSLPMSQKSEVEIISDVAKKYKTAESFIKAMKSKVWDKDILKKLEPIFKDKSQREIGDILRSIFETGKLPEVKNYIPSKPNISQGVNLDDIPF